MPHLKPECWRARILWLLIPPTLCPSLSSRYVHTRSCTEDVVARYYHWDISSPAEDASRPKTNANNLLEGSEIWNSTRPQFNIGLNGYHNQSFAWKPFAFVEPNAKPLLPTIPLWPHFLTLKFTKIGNRHRRLLSPPQRSAHAHSPAYRHRWSTWWHFTRPLGHGSHPKLPGYPLPFPISALHQSHGELGPRPIPIPRWPRDRSQDNQAKCEKEFKRCSVWNGAAVCAGCCGELPGALITIMYQLGYTVEP